MSQENMATLRRGLDAFNRRDKAAFVAMCDPQVENVPPREWPESAPIQGAGAIWDFFVEAVEAWEEGSYEWGELIDVGRDKIVANQLREMRGKTSGAGVAWSFWVVFTFRNGKVLRWEPLTIRRTLGRRAVSDADARLFATSKAAGETSRGMGPSVGSIDSVRVGSWGTRPPLWTKAMVL